MIAGIGIDIIEVHRVREKVNNDRFKTLIFSDTEISYCESCANKGEHYAARFAAKEAFLKATGKGLMAGYDLNSIVIHKDESGKPWIELRGNFLNLAKLNNWNTIHLSFSHVKEMACAMVIIEQ